MGFDAFASYSTDPDYSLVRRVERFIESFHLRRGLRKLKLRELQVCVDGSDFSLPKQAKSGAMQSSISDILYAYLVQSDHLLVFCSPAAATSTWVNEEVKFFIDSGRTAAILLVVTEGANPVEQPESVFPPRVIQGGLHRLPWYDLRGTRRRQAKREGWRKVRDADDEMVRLAAHLLGDTAGSVYPIWRRHRERVQKLVIAAATTASMLVAGLSGWMLYTRSDRYALRQAISAAPPDVRSTVPRVKALLQLGEPDRAFDEAVAIRRSDERVKALLAVAENAARAAKPDRVRAIYEAIIDRPIPVAAEDVLAGCIEAGVSVPQIEKVMNEIIASSEMARASLYSSVEGLVKRGHKREAARMVDLFLDHVLKNREATGLAEDVFDLAQKFPLDERVEILRRMEKQFPPDALREMMEPYTFYDTGAKLIEAYAAAGAVEDALRLARTRPTSLKDNRQLIAIGVAGAINRARALDAFADLSPTEKSAAIARLDDALKPRPSSSSSDQLPDSVIDAQDVIRAGQTKRALDLLREAWPRTEAYERVPLLVAFAEVGADDEARNLLEQLSYNYKERGFEALVNAQIDAGRFSAASATLRMARNESMAESAFSRAAKTADLQFFVMTSELADQPDRRAQLLASAIRDLCEAGRVPLAQRIGELIDQRYDRLNAEAPQNGKPIHAWAWIAETLRKRGDFAGAAAAARRIPQPSRRGCALASVASAQTAREPAAYVTALQREALALAPKEGLDHNQWDEDLSCICHGLSESGDADGALSLVPRFTDDNDRLRHLRDVAVDLAKRGSYRRAISIADELAPATKRTAYDGILTAAAAAN